SSYLELLTEDHTLYNELSRYVGEVPAGLAAFARQAPHTLTRALGIEKTVRLDTRVEAACAGDLFLLCTDGLTDAVPEEDIAAILRRPANLEEMVAALIDRANAHGGPDNVTCVLARWMW